MSDIDIQISHAMPLARARKKADQVAKQLKERFDVDYTWYGNTLKFSRRGVDGVLEITSTSVSVSVTLGALFVFLKSKIEKQIRHNLDMLFGEPPVVVVKPPAIRKARPVKVARSAKTPGSTRRQPTPARSR